MADVQVRVQQIVEGGNNVAGVAKNIENMGTAADRAAVRLAALRAQQESLGRQVASGNLSLDDATKKYSEFKQSLPTQALGQAGNAAKKAGTDFAAMGRQVNDAVGSIQKNVVALAAAGATFKTAFDLGRQGQALTQIGLSFERLNEQVFHTPRLLEDMRSAALGTIKDVDLMAATLTITAGTTGAMSEALARATPDIVAMSKAAAAINPAFGDATFLLESLSVAAKRQSRLLADNAGIIVRMDSAIKQVHPSLKELAGTYEELPEELRFLNEMLFQGNNLLEQAGGAATSAVDPYDRLGVKVAVLTDNFKQWLGEGLLPTVQALSGDYGDAVDGIIDKQRDMAETTDDAIASAMGISRAANVWGGFGTLITGTTSEVKSGAMAIAGDMALLTDSTDEFKEAIEEGFSGQGRAILSAWMRDMGLMADEFYFVARGADTAGMEIERFLNLVNELDIPDEEMEGFARALKEAEGADQILKQYNQAVGETKAAIGEVSQALVDYEARRDGIWTSETIQLHAELETERAAEQLEDFKKTLGGPHLIDISMAGIDPSLQGVIDYFNEDLIETDQRARLNVDAELDEKQIRLAYMTARGQMNSGDYVLPVESEVDQEPIQQFLETARDVNTEIGKIPPVIESSVEGNFDETKGALQAIKALIDGIAGNHTVTFTTSTSGGSSGPPPPNRRASGGSVLANSPYLVGELGPEMFVPGMSGSIIPNSMLASAPAAGMAGGNTSIAINVNGVSDPRRAADEVVRKLQDRGIISRTLTR